MTYSGKSSLAERICRLSDLSSAEKTTPGKHTSGILQYFGFSEQKIWIIISSSRTGQFSPCTGYAFGSLNPTRCRVYPDVLRLVFVYQSRIQICVDHHPSMNPEIPYLSQDLIEKLGKPTLQGDHFQ